LVLTSPTSGGSSVGIVRLWTRGHGVFILQVKEKNMGEFIIIDVIIFLLKFWYSPGGSRTYPDTDKKSL
jgi:hypothetical protein